MTCDWQNYQEEAAEFFRGLGLEATTNLRVKGVRTMHDLDVFVKSHHVGFDVVWIVECKNWARSVTKLHVLALREIVADVGADRGILLSEAGFQSGAIEAATLTNVHATSLADLRNKASSEITAMRLRELFDRIEICRKRYWDIPKQTRIDFWLRPDVGVVGYSGDQIINMASDLISKALRATYPVMSETVGTFAMFGNSREFSSANDILCVLEPLIAELETKLSDCEHNREK